MAFKVNFTENSIQFALESLIAKVLDCCHGHTPRYPARRTKIAHSHAYSRGTPPSHCAPLRHASGHFAFALLGVRICALEELPPNKLVLQLTARLLQYEVLQIVTLGNTLTSYVPSPFPASFVEATGAQGTMPASYPLLEAFAGLWSLSSIPIDASCNELDDVVKVAEDWRRVWFSGGVGSYRASNLPESNVTDWSLRACAYVAAVEKSDLATSYQTVNAIRWKGDQARGRDDIHEMTLTGIAYVKSKCRPGRALKGMNGSNFASRIVVVVIVFVGITVRMYLLHQEILGIRSDVYEDQMST
ncbi:hypothetical protein EI94DRAFT_1705948 [Lactarius quietus]|nr:hypothetical protein EI94DRAFT_1705948 [Lactarius quietus]